MPHIWIRPDLRTDGGESNDILVDGRYAGSMTLIYREGRRLCGAVQLDRDTLKSRHLEEVVRHARRYVNDLLDACGASECDVLVTVGWVEQVIAEEGRAQPVVRAIDEDEPYEADYVVQDDRLDDVGVEERDEMAMAARSEERARREPLSRRHARRLRKGREEAVYYELVLVGENRHAKEYHIYDRKGRSRQLIAEVFVSVRGREAAGEVNWMEAPTDAEIENAVDLIMSDFRPEAIDEFRLEMRHDGEVLDTVELWQDERPDDRRFGSPDDGRRFGAREDPGAENGGDARAEDDISVVLCRDDGDTLTYDIYRQSRGGLPVASATIDLSRDEPSGFVDFHEPMNEDEREEIAIRLVGELEKEKSYRTFNLTMLEDNRWVDEITFENEPVQ
jgi:hypothetical protein